MWMKGASPPIAAAGNRHAPAISAAKDSAASSASPVVTMRQGGSGRDRLTGASLSRWTGSQITALAPLPAILSAIAGGAKP